MVKSNNYHNGNYFLEEWRERWLLEKLFLNRIGAAIIIVMILSMEIGRHFFLKTIFRWEIIICLLVAIASEVLFFKKYGCRSTLPTGRYLYPKWKIKIEKKEVFPKISDLISLAFLRQVEK